LARGESLESRRGIDQRGGNEWGTWIEPLAYRFPDASREGSRCNC
jgi:hypothetical protein